MKNDSVWDSPPPLNTLNPRDLLRQQLILQKFLTHLNNNTLPTLHDDNALKITRIQNKLLEENIVAFRQGKYEQYLLAKIDAVRQQMAGRYMPSQRQPYPN